MNDVDEIENIIIGYFTEIFTSSNPKDLDIVIDSVDLYITSDITVLLHKAFTEEEVIESFHQTYLTKAQSLYGMPALFFKIF